MGDFAQSSPAATNNLRDTLRLRVLAVKVADNHEVSISCGSPLRMKITGGGKAPRQGLQDLLAPLPGRIRLLQYSGGFAFAHPPAMLPAPSQGARAKM